MKSRWAAIAAAVAVLVAGVSVASSAAPSQGAVVRTTDGALRGTVTKQYRPFEGVRYAAPAQRWVHARDPQPWHGVRDATAPGSDCVQEAVFWRPGSAASTNEDCLFLNVHTPTGHVRTGNPNGGKLPNWPAFSTGEQRIGFLAGGRTELITGASFATEHHCAVWASR